MSLLVKAMETGWLLRWSPQTPAVSHRKKMAMKRPDNGDEVHAVLNLIGIGCCFSLGFVGAIGYCRSWT